MGLLHVRLTVVVTDQEHQAARLRVPELRQLSAPAPAALRCPMATSSRRINTTPPTTLHRVEPPMDSRTSWNGQANRRGARMSFDGGARRSAACVVRRLALL